MTRFESRGWLLVSSLTVLWSQGLADEAAASPCAGAAPDAVRLFSDEVRIEAFDAINGMISVTVPAELAARAGRSRSLRLHGAREIIMPLAAYEIPLLLDAQNDGALRGLLTVERWSEAGCDDVEARLLCVSLRGVETPVACRDLTRPLRPQPRVELDVSVGDPHCETTHEPFPAAQLKRVALFVAQECMREALLERRNVRGAMSVQLATTPLGQPRRPKVVVDGLVNQPLSRCLVKRLFEQPQIWKEVPQGARLYLPFYFRGTRPLPAPGPAVEVLPVEWKAP